MKRILSIATIILAFAIQTLAQSSFSASQLQGKWTHNAEMTMSLAFDVKTANGGDMIVEVINNDNSDGISVSLTISISGTFSLVGETIKGEFKPSSVSLVDCTISGPGMDFTKSQMMEIGRSALNENMGDFYNICKSFNNFTILKLEGNKLVIKDGSDILAFNRVSRSVK